MAELRSEHFFRQHNNHSRTKRRMRACRFILCIYWSPLETRDAVYILCSKAPKQKQEFRKRLSRHHLCFNFQLRDSLSFTSFFSFLEFATQLLFRFNKPEKKKKERERSPTALESLAFTICRLLPLPLTFFAFRLSTPSIGNADNNNIVIINLLLLVSHMILPLCYGQQSTFTILKHCTRLTPSSSIWINLC